MAETVYGLCALMSALCAWLLLRGIRANSNRLLLWTGLCFGGLAVNNALLFIDLILVPQVDLSMLRNLTALSAMAVLVFGLVWESR